MIQLASATAQPLLRAALDDWVFAVEAAMVHLRAAPSQRQDKMPQHQSLNVPRRVDARAVPDFSTVDPRALLARGNAGLGAFHRVSDAGGLILLWISNVNFANMCGRGVGLGASAVVSYSEIQHSRSYLPYVTRNICMFASGPHA